MSKVIYNRSRWSSWHAYVYLYIPVLYNRKIFTVILWYRRFNVVVLPHWWFLPWVW